MKDLASVYRDKSPSFPSKATLAIGHLGIILLVLWVLFENGNAGIDDIFGVAHSVASVLRRTALAAAAILYFLRTLATMFVFIRRRMPWAEVGTIAVWVATIDILFAYLGGRNDRPFGIMGVIGVCLLVIGSVLNSGSEWQRHAWKLRPENTGHLFMGGLFHCSRHINYFGDAVLFTGWALMTGRLAPLMIPALMMCGFVFLNVPAQDRYLEERYGEEFQSYSKRTGRLIPYLY